MSRNNSTSNVLIKILLATLLLFALWQAEASAKTVSESQWETPLQNSEIKTTLSHYKGQVIWLDFWASWCVPCRNSFPWLNSLHDRYRSKGLNIIAVNVDENRQDADNFLQQLPARFKVYFDPDGQLPSSFNIQGMPTSVMIDRDGTIRLFHIGFNEDEKASMEALIEKALIRKP
jgi:cytochrome c biogenesis protein CcmG/thiol:disulfide interchange protein DsbE